MHQAGMPASASHGMLAWGLGRAGRWGDLLRDAGGRSGEDLLRADAWRFEEGRCGQVGVAVLPAATLRVHMGALVAGFITWSADSRNRFRLKVRPAAGRIIGHVAARSVEA